jgi:ATP-dependent protease ClpP protease subunit
LFINTNGGNAYDALALIDIIKQSKTPIYTVALGWCMSAGLWIFTAGSRRLIGENATLMFHDVKTWVNDKTSGIRQELEEAERLSQKFCDAIIAVSRIAPDDLKHYIDTKAEWYIPAEKAIKFKLADEIYSK